MDRPRQSSALPEHACQGVAERLRLASRLIAHIDELVSRQVDAILHHSRFQQFESAWLGLKSLYDRVQDDHKDQDEGYPGIELRVLHVTAAELRRDLTLEFDQTNLFRMVYSQEFDTPGGRPFGLLVGDFEVRPLGPQHSIDDLELLAKISQVSAAAFSPFVAGAHPELLGLEQFEQLGGRLNLARHFEAPDQNAWRRLRQSEDSRFVALTLPRVLRRLPYDDDPDRADGFRYRERIDHSGDYVWGSAAYAFAGVVVRAFQDSSWPADIRGLPRGVVGSGLVVGLPRAPFGVDLPGADAKGSSDAIVDEYLENDLGEMGFIPLCSVASDTLVFFGNQSVHKSGADVNERMAAMLQYILCASRFAHYVKYRSWDKIAKSTSARELEQEMTNWLNQNYVAPDEDAPPATKARFPLQQAAVSVREVPNAPGSYHCVLRLQPHYQLDTVAAELKLSTTFKSRTT